ncbi:Hypothetical protein SRAE_1000335000 [Strongyloides ratti]|uniref:Uncharacterized protein n=1 Tax=Strongyloides ratti TaxID=34506 RepID=A0A090L5V2_STRRB|nr:Hypothetical protein SRAE_1000335000 [Strongyloides ratti]CEF65097.1 Hypothetical protein SRAE_1000335000 [Strongyloides ratti]
MTFMNSYYVGASPAYQSLGLNNGFAGYPVSDSGFSGKQSAQGFSSAASRQLNSEPQMATAISSESQFADSFYAGAHPQHNHYGLSGFAGYKY